MIEAWRPPPRLAVTSMQTYSLVRPRTPDFWRGATCQEVSCPRYINGWRTKLDVSTTQGILQARWIADHSRRHFTKELIGDVLTFTFPAGQQCFEKHRVARERDPIFLVRDGDHRGNPTGRRVNHKRGEDWRDDMQETLGKYAESKQKG